jgi:hypothetical protein
MPHFYFDIANDIEVEDPEGLDLDNLAAARQKAVAYARDLAAEAVRQGEIDLKHRIVISDEDRQPVLSVTFREAFVIKY